MSKRKGTGKAVRKAKPAVWPKSRSRSKIPKVRKGKDGFDHLGYCEPVAVNAVGPGSISFITVNGKELGKEMLFQRTFHCGQDKITLDDELLHEPKDGDDIQIGILQAVKIVKTFD